MDQRRVVLAVVLSLAVVVLYNEIVVRPRQVPPPPPTDSVPTPATAPATTPPVAPPPGPTAAPAQGNLAFKVDNDEPVVVDTEFWRATLTPQGGRLTGFELKQFRKDVDPASPPLQLVERNAVLPLTLTLGADRSDAATVYAPSTRSLTVTGEGTGEVVFTAAGPSGQTIEKRIRIAGRSYLFDVDVAVRGGDAPPVVGMVLPSLEREGLSPTGYTSDAAIVYAQGKITESWLDGDVEDLTVQRVTGAQWVAFSVPFFAGAMVSPTGTTAVGRVEPVGSKPVVRLEQALVEGRTSFKVFMGPKSKEVLADAGFDLGRLIDFGWFWFIAIPMLNALRWLHRITGNYGVDIILLTCLVRAATIPLTQKSFRSMKDMQKVQPQLKRLQEQYKDDQAKLQKEMMELYKRHGVNPFSGCLPMVLQIPIFVGLYNALLHAIELRHAPFALWITDLSAPERLMVAGVGIPVMTILMGGTMLLQQWLTPHQGDPMQRQMMMIMPVVFTFMFFNFPSGLVLYWLVSNLLGIVQQYVMLGTPSTAPAADHA